MGEPEEFFYNTRSRNHRTNPNFNRRLSAALVSDIQSENEGDIDDIDPFADSDNEQDADYLPEEDASDIEDEFVIEPNEIVGSDEENEDQSDVQVENDEYFIGKDGT